MLDEQFTARFHRVPVLLAAGRARREEMLSLDGRKGMPALGTFEGDGDCFGFQHRALEIGSRRKRLKSERKGFRDDVGQRAIAHPHQQQAMDVVFFHLFADNG